MFDLDALQQLNPIEQLIEQRAGSRSFKSRGKALRGRCPFHDDGKNPSFDIWPDDWRWRCWTEGIGGNGIDFVTHWDKLPEGPEGFKEACRRLGGDNKLEPAEVAAIKKQHDEKQKQQAAADQQAIDKLRKTKACTKIWQVWHDKMTIDQRSYWTVDCGIPDNYLDGWQLGYTPDLYQDWYNLSTEEAVEHNSAFTIPYFINGEFATVQFRYEHANGNGKYHFAKHLGTAPFITLPDKQDGLVVLHEGAKKAMVTQAHCSKGEFQIISYPSEGDWKKVIPLLAGYQQVIIWGDPGSWCTPAAEAKNKTWLAHPLQLGKAIHVAYPNLDVDVVDYGESDDFAKVDDLILNNLLNRSQYMKVLNQARPLHRIRILRH